MCPRIRSTRSARARATSAGDVGLPAKYVQTVRVRLAFRQFPLPIHAQAQKAAEAAVCAGRQVRFWPYHDLLFASPQTFDEASLIRRASALDLDEPAFSTCLRGEVTAAVRADYAGGGPLGGGAGSLTASRNGGSMQTRRRLLLLALVGVWLGGFDAVNAAPARLAILWGDVCGGGGAASQASPVAAVTATR